MNHWWQEHLHLAQQLVSCNSTRMVSQCLRVGISSAWQARHHCEIIIIKLFKVYNDGYVGIRGKKHIKHHQHYMNFYCHGIFQCQVPCYHCGGYGTHTAESPLAAHKLQIVLSGYDGLICLKIVYCQWTFGSVWRKQIRLGHRTTSFKAVSLKCCNEHLCVLWQWMSWFFNALQMQYACFLM